MERTRKVYPHINKINDHAEALRNELVKYVQFVKADCDYYLYDSHPDDNDDLLQEYEDERVLVMEIIATLKQFIPDED